MSENNTWIRTVYLYIFALAGLIVTVIGSSMLVNLGLKTWIFTEADNNNYIERPMGLSVEKDTDLLLALENCDDSCELTDRQKEQIAQWSEDYEWWQESVKNNENNWQTRQRQSQASTAISMIMVGLPLYLYHWATIKRDRKKETSRKA